MKKKIPVTVYMHEDWSMSIVIEGRGESTETEVKKYMHKGQKLSELHRSEEEMSRNYINNLPDWAG